jgi:hypothetical protein
MRRSTARAVLTATLLSTCALVAPEVATAGSDTVSNGFYTSGVIGPRHSLTRVDVTNTTAASGYYACEDARDSTNSSFVQANHYCAAPFGGYVYHDFCGCELRYGWNGPSTSSGAWMVGVQYW